MGFLSKRGVSPAALRQAAGQVTLAAPLTIVGGTGWGLVLTLNLITSRAGSLILAAFDYLRTTTAGAITQTRITVDGTQCGEVSLDPTGYSQGALVRLSTVPLSAGAHVVNVEAQLNAGGDYVSGVVGAGYYASLCATEIPQ